VTPATDRERAEKIVNDVEVARLSDTAYLTVDDLIERIELALRAKEIETLERPEVSALVAMLSKILHYILECNCMGKNDHCYDCQTKEAIEAFTKLKEELRK
jgi:predicted Mrr-cat superfamily restriction endonuclease